MDIEEEFISSVSSEDFKWKKLNYLIKKFLYLYYKNKNKSKYYLFLRK